MTRSFLFTRGGMPAWVTAARKQQPKLLNASMTAGVFLMVIGAAVLQPGCNRQPGNPLLQAGKFAEVYVVLLQSAQPDSLLPAAADSILASHGYDRRMLQAAAEYYRAHPELWQEVLNLAVQRLEQEVQAAQQRQPADSSVALPAPKPSAN
ncbi:MAG: hypothetical protein DKINENOH_00200 [bacterium]|nr:hypothetical protein [bacterium]